MSDRPAARARAAILAAPWCMTPEMVQTMLTIAGRENLTPEAVAAQLGRPLDNTRDVQLRDGVAIIPVSGPIARHADLFLEVSGGVSIETLATDLRAALDSAAVHSILLHLDSPGGEVNGVGEFAAMVRAADAAKPVTAYVGGMAASAGYWIASAAGEVVIDGSALVGNIGAVMAVPDPEKRRSSSVEFVSSQSPHKRPNPNTEAGRGRLQALVDGIADVFIGAVAQYRGLTPEAIAALGGDILIGQAAVDAGLADRLGSFEGVIAELQARAREPRQSGTTGRVAARTSTGGVMAQEQPKTGRMEKFFSWLAGEGDDSAFAGANIAASGPQPEAPVSSYRAPSTPQPDPEVLALRAELARLKAAESDRAKASVAADATAFAEAEIRAGRALPVEQAALVAAYTEAAEDDAVSPREGQPSRVARLTERQALRPTSALLGELVPVAEHEDGTLTPLTNQQVTEFAAAAQQTKPLTEDEKIRLLALTPTGQAELRRRGIPLPAPQRT